MENSHHVSVYFDDNIKMTFDALYDARDEQHYAFIRLTNDGHLNAQGGFIIIDTEINYALIHYDIFEIDAKILEIDEKKGDYIFTCKLPFCNVDIIAKKINKENS